VLKKQNKLQKMTSSLIPTNFPYLTAEDIVLLSRARGHNFSASEFVQQVGHLSNEVLMSQLSRFMNLFDHCQQYNIDDTDANFVLSLLYSVLSIRPGGFNLILDSLFPVSRAGSHPQ
jgi:hypothetical protein